MRAAEINRMNIKERLHAMELLWESLRQTPDRVPTPDWHQDELRKGEMRVASGQARFSDWAAAKLPRQEKRRAGWMTLRILDLAEADLLDGFRFYEQQEEGVGSYFLETRFSEIEYLRVDAGIHHTRGSYFRMLTKRFPYAVYYRMIGKEIQVWRVPDCRRNPCGIQRQLRTGRS